MAGSCQDKSFFPCWLHLIFHYFSACPLRIPKYVEIAAAEVVWANRVPWELRPHVWNHNVTKLPFLMRRGELRHKLHALYIAYLPARDISILYCVKTICSCQVIMWYVSKWQQRWDLSGKIPCRKTKWWSNSFFTPTSLSPVSGGRGRQLSVRKLQEKGDSYSQAGT